MSPSASASIGRGDVELLSLRPLRILRLHPLKNLLSVHFHVLRRIDSNPRLIAFEPNTVTVISSPTINASFARRVRIDTGTLLKIISRP
jgi:hypothetical protein